MVWLEGLAVAFGLLWIWLTIHQNIWCWPTGLVQVFLTIVILWDVELYSDVMLHVVYVFLQIYGWHHWKYGGKPRVRLPVSRLGPKARLIWVGLVIIGTFGWGSLMDALTDTVVAYAEAFGAVASLVAQWLMVRKKLETWLFWIVADVVLIGIYWEKHLYLTSGLFCAYMVLEAFGWFRWLKSLRALEAAASASGVVMA